MNTINDNYRINVKNSNIRPSYNKASSAVNKQDMQTQTTMPSGVGGLKNYTDALEVLMKAQAIVSQALTVSSKMQSAAMSAMITGSNALSEINTELSGIGDSLKEVEFSSGIAVNTGNVVGINMPEFNKSFDDVQSMAQNGKINNEVLSESVVVFNDTNSKLAEEYYSIADTIAPALKTNAEQIRDGITKNPEQALIAQGNLNPNIITRLTM